MTTSGKTRIIDETEKDMDNMLKQLSIRIAEDNRIYQERYGAIANLSSLYKFYAKESESKALVTKAFYTLIEEMGMDL